MELRQPARFPFRAPIARLPVGQYQDQDDLNRQLVERLNEVIDRVSELEAKVRELEKPPSVGARRARS